MENMDSMEERVKALELENEHLRQSLEYQTAKHNDWKRLAMTFHDTLWKMIDHYVINEEDHR